MNAARACLLALFVALPAGAAYDGPIFDAHLHYNDDAIASTTGPGTPIPTSRR